MTVKPWIIGLIIIVSAAFGRFTAPESHTVETETHSTTTGQKEETKNVSTDAQRDKRVEKLTTEVVRPDGTRETTTRIVEDTTTTKRRESTTDNREETRTTVDAKTKEETVYARGRLSLSAMAGLNGLPGTPVYGGHIQKSVFGPITAGVWGLSAGMGGVSLGLNF